jgi:hypothetical protein
MKTLRYIYKTATTIILLMMTVGAMAQDRECDVYVSNNASGNGLSIRWIGKQIVYDEGIQIYRKQAGGDWQLLNSAPIMPPKSVSPSRQLAPKSLKMYDLFMGQSIEEFRAGFAGVFTIIESVKDFNLALALNIAYNDETAIVNNEYQYRIETTLNGKKTVLGVTEPFKCSIFAPPAAPDSITVERTKKGIEIKWNNAIEKYYFYSVYEKKGEGEWVVIENKIASTALPKKGKKPFVFRKASPDTAYTYKICAYDYFGQQSVMSEEFKMPIQDFDPPAVPLLKLKVNSKKMAVYLSWSENVDDDLSHYNILRSIDPESFTLNSIIKSEIPKEDTTYIDYPERAGSYFYVVEAVDLAGNTARSLFVSGNVFDIRAPLAPKNLIAKVDTGILMFMWDKNSDADLKGYRLFRSVADTNNADNQFVVVNSSLIDTNYYSEPMSKNVRSKFVYHLCAVDSSYNVSKPSNLVLAQLPDVTPPVAPFIKKVYEVEKVLIIEWMPNVEADLAGYNLFKRKKGDTSEFQQLNISLIPKTVSIYKDVEAERGQYYEYYLQAVDDNKLVSEQSNIALGRLEFIPMEGKLIIKRSKVSKLTQDFILEWSLDSIIHEPVAGVSIHKSYNGGKPKQMGPVISGTTYREKLTKPGLYEYHIRVYGTRGNMIKSKLIKVEIEKK